MLTKKLARHGNSLAIVIEKPILDMLDIDDETELQLYTDGVSIIITPVLSGAHHEKIRQIGERIANTHEKALRAMADNDK